MYVDLNPAGSTQPISQFLEYIVFIYKDGQLYRIVKIIHLRETFKYGKKYLPAGCRDKIGVLTCLEIIQLHFSITLDPPEITYQKY